jgi:NAD(P)-dependent dehydrogenase (short-subunit alcohol dehydrogenase family)
MAGYGETPPSSELFADDLFEGEVALVTGGGTGIGEEIALAFADHGADVAIASRDMDHLEPVAERIEERGADAYATTVDVRDYESVEAMTEDVVDKLDSLDILVNNAGANFVTPTEELTPNGWRAVVGTILDGTAFCTLAASEQMMEQGGGVILAMGATNSERGAPFHAHSGAAKAGIHNLMQTVAAEWAEHGIRANTVVPGIIETPGVTEAAGGSLPDELLEDIPSGRFGTPRDCVPTVLFLASPAAAYVSGGYFTVDGGQLMAPLPYDF